MKKNRRHIRQCSDFKQLIVKHISENISIYFKVFLVFIIGICIGIAVVNQLSETGAQNINSYIENSVNSIKNNKDFSRLQVLKSSLFKDVIIVLLIWFLGLTLIGGFILYILALIIGMTFGYTLAALMTSFSIIQGGLFFLAGMFLQNTINIPSIIFLIVQGVKSNKEFISKKNNSLKYIIAKYSACSIGVMFMLVIASLIETYVSGNLIFSIAKYL